MEDLVVEAERVGELTLRGFHRPVPVFNVLRLKDADRHNSGEQPTGA